MALFQDFDRDALRRRYLEAWHKHEARVPLEPLETEIVAVIADHPEYIGWLASGEHAVQAEFSVAAGRENPFLHLGLHLAIREQVATDRPRGAARVHQHLARHLADAHAAEHRMMEPLAETLWEAQRRRAMPDEQAYLMRLERLLDGAQRRR